MVRGKTMADSVEPQLEEDQLEERTLNLLQDSKFYQQFSLLKKKGGGSGKRQKLKWTKRPMAVSEIILEILEKTSREDALLRFSYYLLQRREEEPAKYFMSGYLLFHSCCTLTILLQELLGFYWKTGDGSLDGRSIRHITSVLTLFQSIAANVETRKKFVRTGVPNFLIPLIQLESPTEAFENVRAVALSVVGILCQAREPPVIKWAIESNMIDVCRISIKVGSELSKVIAMHILEAILQDASGLSYICSLMSSYLLNQLMNTWELLLEVLAVDQDFSPRLLFHIIRCYILLCRNARGVTVVAINIPRHFINGSLRATTDEYPVIRSLLNQLLLTAGIVSIGIA